MRTIYYVPAACRERCTIRLVNIRVIINLKFSFKILRAFKYHPRHKKLFAKSTKSCHAWSFFAVSGASLAWSAHPMRHSCVSNVLSPSGSFSQHFGGVLPLNHGTSRPSGKGFLSSWSLCWQESCHTSFTCCCYILACSVSPLFCAWLLSCPFQSDVPSQHRRAFITNMQVSVPIVSMNVFVWCLHQDSMTDFYVLPPWRFIAADCHHSLTAIIVVHHFAVWIANPATFCLPIHFFHHLCVELLLCFMIILCLLAFS